MPTRLSIFVAVFANFVLGVLARGEPVADAEKKYEQAVAEAKQKYDEKADNAKATLIESLTTAMQAATKRADLETALKIRTRIESLSSGASDVAPRKGRVIDLLASIDTQKDAIRGTWVVKNNTLYSDRSENAALQLPYHPPAEYDLKVEFTRLDGNDAVAQILAAGSNQFDWTLGAWSNTLAGFEFIKGIAVEKNLTCVKAPAILTNGKRYTSLVKVRKGLLQAFIDGKLITEWKTDYSDMSMGPHWRIRDSRCLGVGTWASHTTFHSIQVTEVTGQGELLREPAKSEK